MFPYLGTSMKLIFMLTTSDGIVADPSTIHPCAGWPVGIHVSKIRNVSQDWQGMLDTMFWDAENVMRGAV